MEELPPLEPDLVETSAVLVEPRRNAPVTLDEQMRIQREASERVAYTSTKPLYSDMVTPKSNVRPVAAGPAVAPAKVPKGPKTPAKAAPKKPAKTTKPAKKAVVAPKTNKSAGPKPATKGTLPKDAGKGPGDKGPKKPSSEPSGKEPSDKDKEELKANLLSQANSAKPDRLELAVKVPPKQFIDLADVAGKIPLVNGKQKSAHADMNAARHILVNTLIEQAVRDNVVLLDYQGKPRGPTLVKNNKSVPYPHHCREVLTIRDVGLASECGGYNKCSFKFERLMSVDVVTHMTKVEITAILETSISRGGDGVMFAVCHDYYRTPCRDVALQLRNSLPVWIRQVEGNNDPSPDLYQEWVMLGGFAITDSKPPKLVVAREWGPRHKTHGILQLTLTEELLPGEPFQPIAQDGRFLDWAARGGLKLGVYRFKDEVPNKRIIAVLASYVVYRNEEDTYRTIALRTTVEATLKSITLKPVNSGTERSARRTVAAMGEPVDKATFKDVLESSVVVDSSSEQAKARMTWWERWFPPSNIDEKALLAERLEPVVNTTRPVERVSLVTALPSWKTMVGLIHALPKLIGAVPFIILAYKLLRARATAIVTPTPTLPWYSRALRWPVNSASEIITRYNLSHAVNVVQNRPTPSVFDIQSLLRLFTGGFMSLIDLRGFIWWQTLTWVCGLGPLWEEIVKGLLGALFERMSGIASMAYTPHIGYGIGEYLIYRTQLKLIGKSEMYIAAMRMLPLLMHCGISIFRFPVRMAIHIAFNAAVFYTQMPSFEPANDLQWDGTTPDGMLTQEGMPGYVARVDNLPPMTSGAKVRVRDENGKELTPYQLSHYDEKADRPCVYPNTVVFTPFIPRMQANVPTNMYVALRTRVLQERPHEALRGQWARIGQILHKAIKFDTIEWVTFEEWNGRYSGAIQKKNVVVMRQILQDGSGHIKYVVGVFLKMELNHSFFFVVDKNGDIVVKDPRNISPPTDQGVKIIEGPFYYSIAKDMNRQWDGVTWFDCGLGYDCCVLINSGLDPDHVNESQGQRFARLARAAYDFLSHRRGVWVAIAGDDNWMLVSNGKFIILMNSDGSRWDSCIMSEALTMESGLFARFGADSQYSGVETEQGSYGSIDDITRLEKENHAGRFECKYYADDGVTFKGKMPAMRHSGDQKTTLGNNFDNGGACLAISQRIMNALDSTREVVEIGQLKKVVVNAWKFLGIKSDVQIHTNPLLGDFCSSRLMPVGDKWYCVPKFGKFLTRFGCSVSSPRTIGQVSAICTQFEAFADVPFIGPVIQRTKMLSMAFPKEDVDDEFKYSMHFGTSVKVPPPDEETWGWVRDMYTLGVSEHNAVLSSMNNVVGLPWALTVPEVNDLFDVDLELGLADTALGCSVFTMSKAVYKWAIVEVKKFWMPKEGKKTSKKERDARSRAMNPLDPMHKGKAPHGGGKAKGKKRAGAAVSYGNSEKVYAPKITYSPDGSIRIVHKELVGKILSAAVWTVSDGTGKQGVQGVLNVGGLYPGLPLNPGMMSRWLSQLTRNFEHYRFNKLRFKYKTLAATNSIGNVMLSPDYNCTDNAPGDEGQASSFVGTEEASIWNNFTLDCSVSALNRTEKAKFCRTTAVPPGQDQKTYDSGQLFVGVTDCANTGYGIGKLWVEYDVTLMTPQQPVQPQISILEGHSSITPAAPFGVTPVNTTVSDSGPKLEVGSTTATLLAKGLKVGTDYLITQVTKGSGFSGPNIVNYVNWSTVASDLNLAAGSPTVNSITQRVTALANEAAYDAYFNVGSSISSNVTTITELPSDF
jgi:hypothetical protein